MTRRTSPARPWAVLIAAGVVTTTLCPTASAAEVRRVSVDSPITAQVSASASPFTIQGEELAIRGAGSATGRVTADGFFWVEDELPIRGSDVRISVRLRAEGAPGSSGLALVPPLVCR